MSQPKTLQSIRWRLPLSYAAIALVAAASLGVVLLAVLTEYYSGEERAYLESNANVFSDLLGRMLTEHPDVSQDELRVLVDRLSTVSGTQVQLVNADGNVLADSGIPKAWVITLERPLSGREPLTTPFNELRLSRTDLTYQPDFAIDSGTILPVSDVSPVTQGWAAANPLSIQSFTEPVPSIWFKSQKMPAEGDFVVDISMPGENAEFSTVMVRPSVFGGFNPISVGASVSVQAQPRSNQIATSPLRAIGDSWRGHYVRLSQGMATGREIINSVARGWLLASGVAVLLAMVIGWFISRSISMPLVALTTATTRMTHGDLTARASIKRRDELGTLGASFNAMADRIEGTVSALRRFVADAAHEIHTPLTALRTNLELIEEGSNGATTSMAYRALEQVERLEALANDLLDLSRLEAHTATFKEQAVDLAALVWEVSETYASRAEQADLEYVLDMPNDIAPVQGDCGQLRRVLNNLLSNAIKFTPAGGTIYVSLLQRGQQVELAVQDTGIGIPEEDLPHLFSRFRRGRNTANYPGSGLGLAIVKAIADAHGGTVQAANCAPGARITVQLPALTQKILHAVTEP